MTERPMTKEQLEEQAQRGEQGIAALVDELLPRDTHGVRPTLRELIEDTLQRKLHRRSLRGQPEKPGIAGDGRGICTVHPVRRPRRPGHRWDHRPEFVRPCPDRCGTKFKPAHKKGSPPECGSSDRGVGAGAGGWATNTTLWPTPLRSRSSPVSNACFTGGIVARGISSGTGHGGGLCEAPGAPWRSVAASVPRRSSGGLDPHPRLARGGRA